MPLQKQPISINFSKGLDTKTDPYQVQIGNFLSLNNSVFTTSGRLTKRTGYNNIPFMNTSSSVDLSTATTITTLNDNLIATGDSLYAFSDSNKSWANKGTVRPVDLNTIPAVRMSTSQSCPDMSVASNGFVCIVYADSSNKSYYQITEVATGELVSQVELPATATNARAFLLGTFFIVTFMATVSGSPHLQFIAISTFNPANGGTVTDFSSNVSSLNAGYDGAVSTNLYLAWADGGGNVRIGYLTRALAVSATVAIPTSDSDLMSVSIDETARKVWVSFWDSGSSNGYSAAFSYTLAPLMAKTQIITSQTLREITSLGVDNVLNVFYEVENTYGSGVCNDAVTDYVESIVVTPPGSGTGTGTVSSPVIILRSVGLISKAFIVNSIIYMVVGYGDTDQSPASNNSNQPTYFLIDSSGNIYMRLAYSNSGGYARSQVLSSVNPLSGVYLMPYMVTDFLASVNKGTDLPSGTPTAAIYTQTGINIASMMIGETKQYSSEIASVLHLTGGQLWEYDGVKPVEHGFQVWPENVETTTSTSGGSMTAQTYYYQFTYEWTDNAGNLHRSAPSIPTIAVTTTSSSSVTISVPTLRLTYKVSPNPVRIVGYRWSTGQQIYYQFTSLTNPTLNDTTVDSVTFTDTLADSAILGNVLLYTTGGVIENIAAPASVDSALFNNRLWLIDAEDRNLLWYSKQVIENTPVEMSDLLTIYVAPTTGTQGSTGPITAISAMDDKLIIFKKDAAYYINGIGPDNTGANSTYSDPVYITSSVGCDNPNSIVLTPNGLMFQSDKGIWLLGRDLSTNYIGAPVEAYNSQVVESSEVVPDTTYVLFILNDSTTLMYDYYFEQWATHSNISAISGTIYQGLHTYLNSFGQVYQQNPGSFLDGSEPVLMSLMTPWINIAGLQGFERFYYANLLGTYFTPFKLNVGLAYNYNPSSAHNVIVMPDNYGGNWGSQPVWGAGGKWGGSEGPVFTARVFPNIQKCQSFQLSIQEIYDPSIGASPGEGLTLSGLLLIAGVKRGSRTQSAAKSFG